jgi:hypothetical protein
MAGKKVMMPGVGGSGIVWHKTDVSFRVVSSASGMIPNCSSQETAKKWYGWYVWP